ncbi:elongation factor TS-domain-containing protein [Syncephalis pseudoplumigaleata]|uniref:Elongation factor Ts, mitochondrial n=1 Tax=Syncephalis pseudoplumigaleata TaxID=1712513 RepID=A0A4P9Z5L1_9FUNG|nr:elongation factor TS-domain-containing protein [Syncephalis pseudoplumigaleata]|eukprot:RKP27924.1 elongation factor TS-domain-containing protein [Syncephalis pseudoplumigaleata]
MVLPLSLLHSTRSFRACFGTARTIAAASSRALTTSAKPSLAQIVGRLRRETQAPITRARAAAEKFPNDYDAALRWLQEEMGRVGREKASKLAERTANEGMVAVLAGPGARGVLVDMACETDFVAKNAVFRQLIERTAITAMLAGDFSAASTTAVSVGGLAKPISPEVLLEAPLLELPEAAPSVDMAAEPKRVADGILDAVSKLGEKITLRQVLLMDGEASMTSHVLRQAAGYAHGGADPGAGRLASLVVVEAEAKEADAETVATAGFRQALTVLGRDLARQVVGFAPTCIDVPAGETSEEAMGAALLRQPSLQGGGTVAEALEAFAAKHKIEAVRVVDFVRLEAGSK